MSQFTTTFDLSISSCKPQFGAKKPNTTNSVALPDSFLNRLNIEKLHYDIMGAVFRSKDIGSGYKKVIENAIKDLSPDTKDSVIKLLDSWEGKQSEQKLSEIIGSDKAEWLSKQIKGNKVNLTDEDRDALKDILKESLTFD